MKTIVKHENNGEVYLTDAPDVDFDLLNEQQAREFNDKYENDEIEGIVK